MKKFKLIKKYPGSPKLGTIVNYYSNWAMYGIDQECKFKKEDVEKNPEYWEEVFEYPIGTKVKNLDTQSELIRKEDGWYKDNKTTFTDNNIKRGEGKRFQIIVETEKGYEILSYKYNNYIYEYTDSPYTLVEKGKRHYQFGTGVICESTMHYLSKSPIIYSVRRLSDGEVFTIGDNVKEILTGKCEGWTIKKFSLKDSRCFTCGININYIQKTKPVLFTTEDGVEIRKGDNFWFIVEDDRYPKYWDWKLMSKDNDIYLKDKLKFSTKEAAEEFIIMNKPCLSINDISKLSGSEYLLSAELKQLVRSKL